MNLPASLRIARAPLSSFVAMGLLWGALAALYPDVKAGLGVSDALFGLLLISASCAAVLSMLAAPMVGNLLGGASLPIMTAAMGIAFTFPGAAPGLVLFALSMAAVGAASGLLDVLMNARVSTIEAARGVPLMNLSHAAYSFAFAGSAAATGLARGAGMGPAPVLAALGVLVLLLALATIERDARVHGFARRKNGAAGLGLVPILGGLVVLVAFVAENATEAWAALHVERTLGGTPAQGALGPALLGLTMGLGRLAGQAIAARVPELRLMSGAALVAACGAAIVAAAPTPMVAYAGFVVLGLGASVIAPTAFALIGRLSGDERRARAIARASVVGYLGFFFGPALLGGVAQLAGLRASFALVAAALLLSLPLIAALRRR